MSFDFVGLLPELQAFFFTEILRPRDRPVPRPHLKGTIYTLHPLPECLWSAASGSTPETFREWMQPNVQYCTSRTAPSWSAYYHAAAHSAGRLARFDFYEDELDIA